MVKLNKVTQGCRATIAGFIPSIVDMKLIVAIIPSTGERYLSTDLFAEYRS